MQATKTVTLCALRHHTVCLLLRKLASTLRRGDLALCCRWIESQRLGRLRDKLATLRSAEMRQTAHLASGMCGTTLLRSGGTSGPLQVFGPEVGQLASQPHRLDSRQSQIERFWSDRDTYINILSAKVCEHVCMNSFLQFLLVSRRSRPVIRYSTASKNGTNLVGCQKSDASALMHCFFGNKII